MLLNCLVSLLHLINSILLFYVFQSLNQLLIFQLFGLLYIHSNIFYTLVTSEITC